MVESLVANGAWRGLMPRNWNAFSIHYVNWYYFIQCIDTDLAKRYRRELNHEKIPYERFALTLGSLYDKLSGIIHSGVVFEISQNDFITGIKMNGIVDDEVLKSVVYIMKKNLPKSTELGGQVSASLKSQLSISLKSQPFVSLKSQPSKNSRKRARDASPSTSSSTSTSSLTSKSSSESHSSEDSTAKEKYSRRKSEKEKKKWKHKEKRRGGKDQGKKLNFKNPKKNKKYTDQRKESQRVNKNRQYEMT